MATGVSRARALWCMALLGSATCMGIGSPGRPGAPGASPGRPAAPGASPATPQPTAQTKADELVTVREAIAKDELLAAQESLKTARLALTSEVADVELTAARTSLKTARRAVTSANPMIAVDAELAAARETLKAARLATKLANPSIAADNELSSARQSLKTARLAYVSSVPSAANTIARDSLAAARESLTTARLALQAAAPVAAVRAAVIKTPTPLKIAVFATVGICFGVWLPRQLPALAFAVTTASLYKRRAARDGRVRD